MQEKLNLILKVLALRLRLEHGFTEPLVEKLVNEIDNEVRRPPPLKIDSQPPKVVIPREMFDLIEPDKNSDAYRYAQKIDKEIISLAPKRKGWPKGKKRK